MKKPLLQLKNISIKYDDKLVVNNISMSVYEGEILGIVGESGSGKSTLIKSIIGILGDGGRIVEGSIIYEGKDITNLNKKELMAIRGQAIGMIFQDCKSSFCPIRTIGNQLYDSMRAHMKITKKEALIRGEEILRELNIKDPKKFLNSYPFELSGGMNQRAGIMMAMASNPKILLADEPTSALDVTVQRKVIDELMNLRNKFGTTIIIVSHNMGVISLISDNALVMKNGECIEYDSTEKIFNHPTKRYTKELINAMPKLRNEVV
ncbi:ABC transporter ATP-binding protein [Clostridium disporicum]|uniref:Peptide ABC transporter ATPase n=1 Tax=Clostridium disporicum TaxID=84024 RepID=A0A174CWF1_9CLOT|nr:ABC transporter ATP-binding protein [Clostridium disporicum]CUO16449.1 peptide ABC transporter ATPase [Clostridium disporicum]